jgi:hypothetical protein
MTREEYRDAAKALRAAARAVESARDTLERRAEASGVDTTAIYHQVMRGPGDYYLEGPGDMALFRDNRYDVAVARVLADTHETAARLADDAGLEHIADRHRSHRDDIIDWLNSQ